MERGKHLKDEGWKPVKQGSKTLQQLKKMQQDTDPSLEGLQTSELEKLTGLARLSG